jgi:hypothetical protein
VTGIRPTADEVPVNLLRCYVWFSAPMSQGHAAKQVRLARDDGSVLDGALLPAHQEAGYPLRPGQPFRLIVGSGFLDAQGLPLRAGRQLGQPGVRPGPRPPRRPATAGPAGRRRLPSALILLELLR